MGNEQPLKKRKKVTYGAYTKIIILACLVVLAVFLAPWLWIFIGLWLVWMIARKFKKNKNNN